MIKAVGRFVGTGFGFTFGRAARHFDDFDRTVIQGATLFVLGSFLLAITLAGSIGVGLRVFHWALGG